MNNNIQVLEDYRGVLSEEYWDSWARNPYREEKGSFRDQNELRKVAEEMNYSEIRDMAYKHVSFRSMNHQLQVVEFGGRFFVKRAQMVSAQLADKQGM